ncbi:hypothetical protein [Amycolatopsis arida]|uniref:hypothetical protein n=1 Tax=Amycolatopsis arida TaxID=587909 RepID=UPI0010654DCE|nr:hypothetical protein [Amycolatopsis arida]
MATDQPSPEVALVRYLRAQGFTVEAGDRPGSYRVTAHRDAPMPRRPRLSLPDDLLTEYLNELDRTPGAAPGLSALSLTEVHLEEALAAGVDGQNQTTAVGVRRTPQGAVEWFWHREAEPGPPGGEVPQADLVWRADRPR